MATTTTAEKNLLAAFLYNGGTYTPDTTLYMGLAASIAADGTITTEPTIGTNGYARVSIAMNNTTVWGAASGGIVSNTAIISFPTSTGAWATGTRLNYWFLSTASSGGTVKRYGLIDNGAATDGTVVTDSGTTISFAAGEIDIDMSGW
jgi:hypothetical protein